MILKSIVSAVDTICAISCIFSVISDDADKKIRVIDLLIAIGLIANLYILWG